MKRSVMLLLACLALVAAACGGTEASEDVASLETAGDGLELAVPEELESESELTQEEAFLAFTACMRDEGIDLPDPEVDSEGNVQLGIRQAAQTAGLDREQLQAGFEVCGELIEGFTQGFQRPDQTEIEDQLLAFAQCLRDQGLDVDDPDLNFTPGEGGGQGGGPFGDLDLDDPEFQAAAEQCEEFLPNFGGGGGPGGGGRGGDGDA